MVTMTTIQPTSVLPIIAKIYSMFHETWTTFKSSRNQLGMVSVHVVTMADCLSYVHT